MKKEEHEDRLKRMIEEITKNAEGKPLIRPVNLLGQRQPRKVNVKNDKLITKEKVEQQIIAKYPEQAKYWLGNGRGKHTAVDIAIKCPKCHSEGEVTLRKKADLRELLKADCPYCEELEEAQNQHLNIPLPFGKFRGKSINFVMKKQPNYLAWFVDKVKGEEALVERIEDPHALSAGVGRLRGETSRHCAESTTRGNGVARREVLAADDR